MSFEKRDSVTLFTQSHYLILSSSLTPNFCINKVRIILLIFIFYFLGINNKLFHKYLSSIQSRPNTIPIKKLKVEARNRPTPDHNPIKISYIITHQTHPNKATTKNTNYKKETMETTETCYKYTLKNKPQTS